MNVAELRKIRMLVHEATLALTSARAHWTFRRARRWMARLFMDDALKQLAEAETRLPDPRTRGLERGARRAKNGRTVSRLDAFVAILDVLKELPEKDAAALISLLFTLNGQSLRFLLKGDPGEPETEET